MNLLKVVAVFMAMLMLVTSLQAGFSDTSYLLHANHRESSFADQNVNVMDDSYACAFTDNSLAFFVADRISERNSSVANIHREDSEEERERSSRSGLISQMSGGEVFLLILAVGFLIAASIIIAQERRSSVSKV